MLVLCICSFLVYVLGIDKTTAHSRLHVDEVELNNTRDIAPIFLVQIVACTLFGSQFQINT